MSDLEALEEISDQFLGIEDNKPMAVADSKLRTGRERANAQPQWRRALRAHQSNKKRISDNALIDDAMRKRIQATGGADAT